MEIVNNVITLSDCMLYLSFMNSYSGSRKILIHYRSTKPIKLLQDQVYPNVLRKIFFLYRMGKAGYFTTITGLWNIH